MLFGSHVKAGFAALLEGASRGSHLRSLEIEHHNASAPGSHKLTGFAALYKGGGRGGHVQSLEDGCPGHLRLILRSILQRFIGNGRSVANNILFARRVNVLPALRPFHKSLAASRAPISRRQGHGDLFAERRQGQGQGQVQLPVNRWWIQLLFSRLLKVQGCNRALPIILLHLIQGGGWRCCC